MNQSFETELQVVLRALGEVVLPALDGAEKHVVEQLQLSIAALDFMRQRLPHAGRFYRGELARHASLADDAAELITSDGADTLQTHAKAARTLLKDPAADWRDYIELTRRLREAIAVAVERDAGSSDISALDAIVIAAARDIHLQSRVWCRPFGFELKPEDLPQPTWE